MAGFGDGFATGFGLVNDTYKRRAQEKLAETELEDRRTRDKGAIDFRNAQLEKMDDESQRADTFRAEQLASTTAFRQQQTDERLAQIEKDRLTAKNNAANDALTRRRMNAQLDTADREALDKAATQAKIDAQITEANLAQELYSLDHIDTLSEDQIKTFSQHIQTLQGGTFDPSHAASPLRLYQAEAFRESMHQMANGQPINNNVMEHAVGRVLSASTKFSLGQKITLETHPSAPLKMQGQGFRITGINVRKLIVQGDEKGQYLKPEVMVNLENDLGEQTGYITDMTEKRQGTGAPVRLYVDKLLQAQAAQMNVMDFATQNKDQLLAVQQHAMFMTSNGDFDRLAYRKEFDRVEKQELELIDLKDKGGSPIVAGSSVLWNDFKNSERWPEYVKHKVLFPEYQAEPDGTEVDYVIATLRESPVITAIEKERSQRKRDPLSDRQILEASTYFTRTKKGVVLDTGSQREWNALESRLRGKVQSKESDPSAFRSSGQRKSAQGWLGSVRNVQEGGMMTEVSIGVEINGEEIEIPAMVPTLTKAEINTLANMKLQGNAKNIPKSIKDKAIAHAKEQLSQGLSPFFDGGSAVPPKKNILGGTAPLTLQPTR